LNNIVHPRVIDLLRQRSATLEEKGTGKVQVWDVPLLFEAGLDVTVDLILVVAAREDVQVQRLVQRNSLSMAQALRRIRAQMPLAEKISSADHVIYNSGTLNELSEQVDRFWKEIADKFF